MNRVDIINGALIKLGTATIASPDESSQSARTAKAVYDRVARSEMRRHPWSFALSRATLPALSTPPAFGFLYQYQQPDDFLRLYEVANDAAGSSGFRDFIFWPTDTYAIEGNAILTDYAAPLQIRYVADMSEQEGTWDAAFCEAMVIRLAQEMCFTITKSQTREDGLIKMYKSAIFEARRVNAIELPNRMPMDDTWMQARNW